MRVKRNRIQQMELWVVGQGVVGMYSIAVGVTVARSIKQMQQNYTWKAANKSSKSSPELERD